jgi:hypothetical protein
MFARKPKDSGPPLGPTLPDILHSIDVLRAPGNLCYARLMVTNQGFSAELSFNSVSAKTGSGIIEVCLREAAIELTSPLAAPDWSWNEELLATAEASIANVEQTDGESRARSDVQVHDLDARLGGRGGIKLPLVDAMLNTEIRQGRKTESRDDQALNRSTRVTREVRNIGVEKRAESFRVRFSAHHREDLSDLNPRLARLPLLDVPSPAALDFNQVHVDLILSHDTGAEEVRHAYHIRTATGLWRPLTNRPNRRALAELLLSKFLPDIHDPQRIWPPEATP